MTRFSTIVTHSDSRIFRDDEILGKTLELSPAISQFLSGAGAIGVSEP